MNDLRQKRYMKHYILLGSGKQKLSQNGNNEPYHRMPADGVFEFRLALLAWLPTKAEEYSLLCYFIDSWEEKR